jgi:hypothetical protein
VAWSAVGPGIERRGKVTGAVEKLRALLSSADQVAQFPAHEAGAVPPLEADEAKVQCQSRRVEAGPERDVDAFVAVLSTERCDAGEPVEKPRGKLPPIAASETDAQPCSVPAADKAAVGPSLRAHGSGAMGPSCLAPCRGPVVVRPGAMPSLEQQTDRLKVEDGQGFDSGAQAASAPEERLLSSQQVLIWVPTIRGACTVAAFGWIELVNCSQVRAPSSNVDVCLMRSVAVQLPPYLTH